MKAEKAISDLMDIRHELYEVSLGESDGDFKRAGFAAGTAMRLLYEFADRIDGSYLGCVRILVRVTP